MSNNHEYRVSSIQHREFDIERRETRDKRLLIMKNSICETRETSDERLFFIQNSTCERRETSDKRLFFIQNSTCERRETSDKRLFFIQNSTCERRETSDKRLFFLQNEPNFKITQNYTTSIYTSGYDNYRLLFRPKNEPKRTQNEPNFSPKLASFFQNEPNFKPNSVKIGNLRPPNLSRSAFRFYSVFCVPCSVSFFVANDWLCFLPKIAVKWLAKNISSLCFLWQKNSLLRIKEKGL